MVGFGLVERVLMFDNFWLDLVVLVLTTFFVQFCLDFHKQKKKKKKNNGLKYRVAAQLKILLFVVNLLDFTIQQNSLNNCYVMHTS